MNGNNVVMTVTKQAYLHCYMGDDIRPPEAAWLVARSTSGRTRIPLLSTYSTASMACGKLPTKDTPTLRLRWRTTYTRQWIVRRLFSWYTGVPSILSMASSLMTWCMYILLWCNQGRFPGIVQAGFPNYRRLPDGNIPGYGSRADREIDQVSSWSLSWCQGSRGRIFQLHQEGPAA